MIDPPKKTNMRIVFDTVLTAAQPQLLQNNQEELLYAL